MLAGAATSALHAQPAAPPVEEQAIIVTGVRELLGVPVERSLDEDDVTAYGLDTVGELLDEIAAENGEARDDPVFLVDGERVAGLGDVEDYPAEAIARIQVLPPGAATRLGASANRRVYNIVLRPRTTTAAARAAVRTGTDNDWTSRRGDVSFTHIRRPRRVNLAVRVRDEDALRESDLAIVQPPGSDPRLGRFRTLRPALDGLQLNLSAADQLAPWLSGTLTGRLARTDRRALQGLAEAGDPIGRRSRTDTGELNLTLNATSGDWFIGFIGSYDEARRRTITERVVPTGPGLEQSRTRAATRSAQADLVASGPLFRLPAGPLRLTLGLGLGRDSIRASRFAGAVATQDLYAQSSRTFSAGLAIPIASRDSGALAGLGELSGTAQFSATHVTDFGWLSSQTYSLSWRPDDWLRLFGSIGFGRTPPAVGFVADPLLETPGTRYLDPLTGETVDVLEISGGNPALGTQSGENRRLSANIRPIRSLPLQITAEYQAIRNRDIITALPPASALLILAFPERFTRDASGRLIQVDVRPVAFARQSEEQLRYGLTLSLPLGGGRPAPQTAAAADPGGGGGGGEGDDQGARAARRTPRFVRPRLQLNFSHAILLESELLLRAGTDPIDLLSREAVALGGAARPRHQFDLTLGYAERGLGIRLIGQHRTTSFLNLVSGTSTDVLRFSPLTTFTVRAFVNGDRLFPDAAWLRGSRVTVTAFNLGNARQRVRNSAGETPIGYQPGYRDPLGRTIEIQFRKVF